MNWQHMDPRDCPTPKMVADLTLGGGGGYEPTGTVHAECPGHCQHVWVEGWVVTERLDVLRETCRDCGEERDDND